MLGNRKKNGMSSQAPKGNDVIALLPELKAMDWVDRNGVLCPAAYKGKNVQYIALLWQMLSEAKTYLPHLMDIPTSLHASPCGDLVDQAQAHVGLPLAMAQTAIRLNDVSRVRMALQWMALGWDGESCLRHDCAKKISPARQAVVLGTMLCIDCMGELERQRLDQVSLVFGDIVLDVNRASA